MVAVSLSPDALGESIRDFLSGNDNLLKGEYGDDEHPLSGHCFVASQAYLHMSDRDLTPMQMQHEGVSHWFLRDNDTGQYIDLTADQFDSSPTHADATGRGFGVPGGGPCSRTQTVIEAISSSN